MGTAAPASLLPRPGEVDECVVACDPEAFPSAASTAFPGAHRLRLAAAPIREMRSEAAFQTEALRLLCALVAASRAAITHGATNELNYSAYWRNGLSADVR